MIIVAAAKLCMQPERLDSLEAQALIEALVSIGNQIVIFAIAGDLKDAKEVIPTLPLEIGEDLVEEITVYEAKQGESTVYLLDSTMLRESDSEDEIARIFGLATAEVIKALKLNPKIVHCQGWHTALAATACEQKTVFSLFDVDMAELGVEAKEFIREALKRADSVLLGSKEYLDNLKKQPESDFIAAQLQSRSENVFALNFPLAENFDPATDEALESKFSKDTIKERPKNLSSFVLDYKLNKSLKTIVVGLVGDLRSEGGDEIIEAIEGLATNNIRTIGSVIVSDMQKVRIAALQEKFPGLIGVNTNTDFAGIRKTAAASDVVLFSKSNSFSSMLPLMAMKYGALPVAPDTGVYADVVQDYNPNKESGTGFLYEGDSKYNMLAAVIRAQEVKKFPYDWSSIVDSAADSDIFWRDTAKQVIDIYRQTLGLVQDQDPDEMAEEAAEVPIVDRS